MTVMIVNKSSKNEFNNIYAKYLAKADDIADISSLVNFAFPERSCIGGARPSL